MTCLLSDSDLARIVGGSASVREAGDAVLHLATCASCHRRLFQRHPEQGRRFLEGWLEEFAASKGLAAGEVSSCLPEFFSGLEEEDVRSVHKVPAQIRALQRHSKAHQLLLVTNSSRFHTLAFLEYSLAEARGHWLSKPTEALRWASIAVAVGQRGKQEFTAAYGGATWSDALARSWAYLANGHRIAGELHLADKALAKSLRLLDGNEQLESKAEILGLEASLRRDQRRFQDSWLAASSAERIYQDLGQIEHASLAALVSSSALAEGGEVDLAILKLQEALRALPRLALGGRTHFGLLQNLAWRLMEADRGQEALELLPKVKELATCFDEPLTEVRVEWLAARIYWQLDERRAAENGLREVCRVFLASGSSFDAALAGLDLAALLIEDRRQWDAAVLAHDLVPIFRSRAIHREAAAAGLLVARSLSMESATVDFVHHVAGYLRQARRDPSYRSPG